LDPIVIKLPLESLTTSLGRAERCRDVGVDDIRSLLQQGRVRFIVADVGMPLRWILEPECYDFWRRDVSTHIGDPAGALLQKFSGDYCYCASEWSDGAAPIILLEKAH